MHRSCILAILAISIAIPLHAQETSNLTTLYPSPYGSYEDMEISSNLSLINNATNPGKRVSLSATCNNASVPDGNLTISGSEDFYQIGFTDGGTFRPYSYISTTACASGYVVTAMLDSNRIPTYSTASAMYAVCTRGTE